MTTHLAGTFPEYAAQLREFIRLHSPGAPSAATPSSDDEFDALARPLFALQFGHNAPYRRFCETRKVTPQNLGHWTRIPAMPAAAFKELELTSLPASQRARVFHSSGTTGQRPSRHFHNADSLALYEASLLPWFAAHLLPDAVSPGSPIGARKHNFFFLTPPPPAAPHSSLVHMLETIRREFGAPDSRFTGCVGGDGAWTIDVPATVAALRETIAAGRPVVLAGTAFGFVHLLDALRETGARLRLPPGSRAMETGGYKNRSRNLPRPELHRLITELLGIPDEKIVCEYGMSELSSQAYQVKTAPASFLFPPWTRAQIISPETGLEVAEGETGLIRVFDPANVQSVMAIQTEDLGVRRGGGFELLGRAALAEPRGCSLQSA